MSRVMPSRIDDERSDQWTTRALIDGLWKNGVPEYSLIWLRDPDHMEHKTAPGSPESIARVTRGARVVMRALDRKLLRDLSRMRMQAAAIALVVGFIRQNAKAAASSPQA